MKSKWLLFILLIIFGNGQIFSQNYASIYLANGSTDLISATLNADTWQQITGYSAMENHANWSVSSDALTPTSSAYGNYLVRYSLSFTSTTNAVITATVMVNGTEQSELTMTRKIGTNSDVGNIAGTGFISIASTSDVVTLAIKSDISTDEFTPIHSQLVLVELDESATPKYAEMVINNNSTEQSVTTAYSTINNYTASSNLEGWTFSSNELTALASSAGTYLIVYTMNFKGNGPEEYDFGIAKNTGSSSNTPDQILLGRTISSSGNNYDVGNAVATGIMTIAEGDIISVMGKAGGSKTITAIYSNVSLIKIAESNNANEYANMNIVDNSTATTISASNTWYQITNFTQGFTPSSEWTFNSTNKSLKAGINAPGVYLVNYCIGVQLDITEEKSNVYSLVTISINGAEQSNLITNRLMPSKVDDVGSISGSGIVLIENLNDEITMEIQNTLDATNFVVEHSNLSVFRVGDQPEAVPVELTSFSAKANNISVVLNWQTATEVNNYGFEIEKALQGSKIWEKMGFVDGHGNSNSPKNYSFIDSTPVDGVVQYRLKQIDTDGASEYSEVIVVEGNNEAIFKLSQNHPNPFNPTTKISFSIPQVARVSIIVYNSIGQEIAELVNADFSAGNHSVDFDGSNLSSGMYFYTLKSAGYFKTMKMMLVK